MEHQTIPPGNDSAGQRPMRQTVTCHPQRCARRKDPEEQEVEDVHVVAHVEQEVVPVSLLVLVCAKWEEIQCLERICDMYPPRDEQIKR